MVQFVRPTSDIAAGGWTTSPLWSKIDEGAAGEDNVVITSADNTSPDNADFGCNSVSTPDTGDHILRARWNKSASGGHSINAILELWQGLAGSGTLIATLSVTGISETEQTSTYTLTGAEVSNITDYGDLDLRLSRQGDTGGPPGGRRSLVCEFCELEVPDAPAGDPANERDFNAFGTPPEPPWHCAGGATRLARAAFLRAERYGSLAHFPPSETGDDTGGPVGSVDFPVWLQAPTIIYKADVTPVPEDDVPPDETQFEQDLNVFAAPPDRPWDVEAARHAQIVALLAERYGDLGHFPPSETGDDAAGTAHDVSAWSAPPAAPWQQPAPLRARIVALLDQSAETRALDQPAPDTSDEERDFNEFSAPPAAPWHIEGQWAARVRALLTEPYGRLGHFPATETGDDADGTARDYSEFSAPTDPPWQTEASRVARVAALLQEPYGRLGHFPATETGDDGDGSATKANEFSAPPERPWDRDRDNGARISAILAERYGEMGHHPPSETGDDADGTEQGAAIFRAPPEKPWDKLPAPFFAGGETRPTQDDAPPPDTSDVEFDVAAFSAPPEAPWVPTRLPDFGGEARPVDEPAPADTSDEEIDVAAYGLPPDPPWQTGRGGIFAPGLYAAETRPADQPEAPDTSDEESDLNRFTSPPDAPWQAQPNRLAQIAALLAGGNIGPLEDLSEFEADESAYSQPPDAPWNADAQLNARIAALLQERYGDAGHQPRSETGDDADGQARDYSFYSQPPFRPWHEEANRAGRYWDILKEFGAHVTPPPLVVFLPTDVTIIGDPFDVTLTGSPVDAIIIGDPDGPTVQR